MSAKRAKVPRPTDAELEILRVLWHRGPSTVRQVHEALANDKDTSFNTKLKLLQIMHAKGLVTRDDSGRPHVYRAAAPEAQMQKTLLSDLLRRGFGGSARKLVVALTATDIPDDELAEIRKLLDELGEKGS